MDNKTLMAGLKEFFKCLGCYIKDLWILLIVSAIILLTLHFSIQSNANSVRYMLSALVQSEAAIVAIVITLTLIAVQLTASAYSPRVIDIFIKNPDMKVLFCLYGISIFYGLLVLRYVDEAEGSVVIQSVIMAYGHIPIVLVSTESAQSLFEWLTLGALLLGIFSFAALIPYIQNISELLKPSNIIRRLSENINEDVLKYINKNPNDTNIRDPVQPIVDIICGALEKHDLETARESLEIIGKLISSVKGMQGKEKNSNVSSYFCNHLQGIGTLTAKGEHNELTKGTIEKIEKIFDKFIVGDNYAKNGLEEAMKKIASSLSAIGEASVRKRLGDATSQAVRAIGIVGKASASNGFKDVTNQATISLRIIGEASARCSLVDATGKTAICLGDIGEVSVDKEGLVDATKQIVLSLEAVGEAASSKRRELEDATSKVVKSLENIGIKFVEKGEIREDATCQAIKSLGTIGEAGVKGELRDATKQVVCSLGAIGKESSKKSLEKAAEQVAYYLGTIGKASVSKEVIGQIVCDLTYIGMSVAKKEKELEDALWEVVLSLESVGIAVVNRKEHEKVAKDVIKSLKEIGDVVYIDLELKDATWQIAKSMGSIGFFAADKGKELENVTKKVIESLEDFGVIVADCGKELETVTKEVAKSLGVIGEIVVEKRKKELTEVTKDVVKSLQTVGEAAVDNELEKTGIKLADSLRSIGVTSAEYGVEDITEEVIYALKTLGIKADNKFADLAWVTVFSLSVVGKSAALNGIKLEDETRRAIIALGIVGKEAPGNIKDVSRAVTEIADIAIQKTPNSKIDEAKDQVLKALK